MQDNYFSFLDYRAAKRRLLAKFASPRWVILHTLAFEVVMNLGWAYGLSLHLFTRRDHYIIPVLIGAVWSSVLAIHSLIHFCRSAAMTTRREIAVEDEMRQYLENNSDQVSHDRLFEVHQDFEQMLERQGRWSISMLVFALANAALWIISAIDMGTSLAFQGTLPLALFLIGGVNLIMVWQRLQQVEHKNWFARLPLRHMLAYPVGVLGLALMGGYGLINRWDADTLIVWWGLILCLHTLWNLVISPAKEALTSRQVRQAEKRKSAERLVLADDGELINMAESEIRQYQANSGS